MLLLKFIIYSFLFINSLFHSPKTDDSFRSPLKIPVLLSSNFGELRIDHFHSGIDIKTQGETGKEVVAAAEGYVYRISVSPGGFGKALYLKHPSGLSTVYGHLDRFTPDIEAYVRAMQYEKQSFLVTLFPDRDQFPVKAGDIIAYSGNSGSSGGPHLHYEIRETVNEKPLNPLLFNTGASDNIAPVIEKIAIYPVSKNTFINSRNNSLKLNVKGSGRRYTIVSDRELVISGNAGFGIKTYDLLNGAPNKCAAYSIELQIDSNTIYKYLQDGFPFSESRFVNSHIDYETFMKENTYFERAYVLPNDKLGNYSHLVNRGVFNFHDEKRHNVRFMVTDASGNKSTLSFFVRATLQKPAETTMPEAGDIKIMPYEKTNRFTAENVSVTIPSGALYDTLWFSFKHHPGTPVMLSDIYSIHNDRTALQRPITLMIKPNRTIVGKESKMIISQLNENMSKRACNSTWDEDFLKAEVLNFGNYFVSVDTIPPVISSNGLAPGVNLTGRKEMRIMITDDFSGIKSYEPIIDGKWALFEYDAKNNVLIYYFDSKYITKGTKHSLNLKVSDNVDNVSYYSCNFVW